LQQVALCCAEATSFLLMVLDQKTKKKTHQQMKKETGITRRSFAKNLLRMKF
jgi:hypothetical protein